MAGSVPRQSFAFFSSDWLKMRELKSRTIDSLAALHDLNGGMVCPGNGAVLPDTYRGVFC